MVVSFFMGFVAGMLFMFGGLAALAAWAMRKGIGI